MHIGRISYHACFGSRAARNPLFNYDQRQKATDLDRTPGPKTDNYPSDCLVEDCLIHLTGRVEKQTAGVNIDLAQNITVRHCSIYDMPRAGINIGDGCWGGHVVEWCDVFDTVKETGDHGSFNSWGRDRWWKLKDVGMNDLLSKEATKDLVLLDCVKQNVLRNAAVHRCSCACFAVSCAQQGPPPTKGDWCFVAQFLNLYPRRAA